MVVGWLSALLGGLSVDIIVTSNHRAVITIDVKGLAKPYDWPADNFHDFDTDHFYALVCFEKKITNPDFAPPVWIIPANQLRPFIKDYRNRKVVSRAAVNENGLCFKNAWLLIVRQPPTSAIEGDIIN
jgi:hypothetical protein